MPFILYYSLKLIWVYSMDQKTWHQSSELWINQQLPHRELILHEHRMLTSFHFLILFTDQWARTITDTEGLNFTKSVTGPCKTWRMWWQLSCRQVSSHHPCLPSQPGMGNRQWLLLGLLWPGAVIICMKRDRGVNSQVQTLQNYKYNSSHNESWPKASCCTEIMV